MGNEWDLMLMLCTNYNCNCRALTPNKARIDMVLAQGAHVLQFTLTAWCTHAMHAGTTYGHACMQAPTSSSGVVSKIRHAAYMENGRISGRSKGLSPTTWLPKALCGRSRSVGIWLGPCLGGQAASRFHPPCCHRYISLQMKTKLVKNEVARFEYVSCCVSRTREHFLVLINNKACRNATPVVA